MSAHELYVAHREVIERALASVCRRHQLSGVDAEDFSSGFRLRLIENDYGAIRAFRGRSSLQTYLLAVITHYFQDWRNARWGKWRPSAEAKRLGPVAIRLETLIVRDGLTLDQAHETLRGGGILEPRQALETLAAQFPVRPGRTFLPVDVLATHPAAVQADTLPEASANERMARRATGALRRAIGDLGVEDRLILRMRYESDCNIADIARALQLEQKPLYRRLERLLVALRTSLEQQGITAEIALDALRGAGFGALDPEVGLGPESRGDVRPLEPVTGAPREERTK